MNFLLKKISIIFNENYLKKYALISEKLKTTQ